MSNDVFANPQAPANYVHHPSSNSSKDDSLPLTNDDFRKLLMTPSAAKANKEGLGGGHGSSKVDVSSSKKKLDSDAQDRRREKKLFYASLVKEEKEREAELAQKYRDRAKERRELTKDGKEIHTDQFVSTTANFKAVAPEFSVIDQAKKEIRKKIIEESKFLGGDLEHTHLVKGLDYALLSKIKAEINRPDNEENDDEQKNEANAKTGDNDNEKNDDDNDEKGSEDEDEDEDRGKKSKLSSKANTAALVASMTKSLGLSGGEAKAKAEQYTKQFATAASVAAKLTAQQPSKHQQPLQQKKIALVDPEGEEISDDPKNIQFKTKLGRNVYRVLFESQPPKLVNDHFLPHRMTYIVDLNDEETDVPITSIRSKADCPNNEVNSTLTTNDIVINKLTQILSYLRHGKRDAKKIKKKGAKGDEATSDHKREAGKDLGIYDDLGDYIPEITAKKSSSSSTAATTSKSSSSSSSSKDKDKKDEKSSSTDSRKNYFGTSSSRSDEVSSQVATQENALSFIKNINEKYANKKLETKKDEKKTGGMSVKFDIDSYSECYPGTKAEEDVNVDSDEDADFSKMDLGNKKGPVNRWDFDTNEEYSDYMSNKEALPKAAFQYGVKMADGRKTKKIGPDGKQDKAKFDREWTQISKIIDKRKSGDKGEGGDYKKPKY